MNGILGKTLEWYFFLRREIESREMLFGCLASSSPANYGAPRMPDLAPALQNILLPAIAGELALRREKMGHPYSADEYTGLLYSYTVSWVRNRCAPLSHWVIMPELAR